MNFPEYQKRAHAVAEYPGCDKVDVDEVFAVYPVLGLNGEAGEVAERFKKIIRDDNRIITEEKRTALFKELGDCLWYLNETAMQLGFSLEEIAQANIDKLEDRQERGVIQGDGDNR